MSNKSKHLAGISLAVMGTGFAATIPFQGTIAGEFLQGGFEAGLVGGLADWFAVTALFRHPFGIPIPHTALLPKNRSRMIKALVHTIENDWLSKESIQTKLTQINMTEKLMPILEKELQSDSFKKTMKSLIIQMIESVDLEKLAPLIQKQLKGYLTADEIMKLLQALIKQVLERKYDEKSFDYLLVKIEEWASRHDQREEFGRFAMRAIDNGEADGFLQFAIKSFRNMINEEKLGKILQDIILNVIRGLRRPDSEYRQAILGRIRKELLGIQENHALLEEIDRLILEWDPSEKLMTILKKTQDKALAYVEEGTVIDDHLMPFAARFLENIRRDQEKTDAIENKIQEQIALFIEKNHSKIGKLVEENLNKLDDEKLIDMIENNVGKDLQWIRVNGAVCGFFIGIVLTGVKMLF
ncbi:MULTISPECIES: DUF445 domain-containing protein [Bacillaceae]|uniref:DUF445 domain-containing protein n=1 Tax=Bacillaceae TaxID=186817 RepID=UPI000C78F006|nr:MULTISPECIES: DUF445 domain-containing protein [Bacillaceae]PLR68988.1 DUF445 domain-containing protein [Bacillus sp. UMB0893]QNG59552.1 DUF445 domain-containing protein [Bacillus sp. PAMC26568]